MTDDLLGTPSGYTTGATSWEPSASAFDALREAVAAAKSFRGRPSMFDSFPSLGGFKIVVSDLIPLKKAWVYPVERFWEYTPSAETERWCRYFGYGHEGDEIELSCTMIDGVLYMHSTVFEAFKRSFQRAAEGPILRGGPFLTKPVY